ncbi:hypothetical protein ACIPPM_25655 [Streptomyces sp. NPDC090119]|uniref:hypothetical protein n=1 Tax=Streptomyces sp. NPDC090119 TaxID=3365951 RepID=UPI0037F73F3D
MGIESDQVVYEYLSRVGDVAHQRQLPSSTRMRLVSELRNEIDRHRARATVDSPAAVRRILDQLGSPDAVVRAVGGGGTVPPPTVVPVQPEPEKPEKPERRPRGFKGLRAAVPRPRPADTEPAVPAPTNGASPPHLAPAHELGESLTRPDWWRVADGPFGAAAADSVPGFVGGVEIPEMLRRPPKETEETDPTRPKEAVVEPVEVIPRSRFRRFVPLPAAGWTNPLLLLGAAALLVGAVLGNWFALLLGWLIAYGSRRLTPAETKWAVLVLPALAVAAGVTYLWGRNTGHWGTPVAEGHLSDALTETWPWVVRGAAVSSALFLLWRSQRRR